MRAMILAAGRGERMRPLTDRTPKPLLELGGKPLIVHHVERLVAAGIRELVVNLWWLGARIEAALGDGEAFGARIRYSREPDGVLETAGGIRNALPLLGDDPFLVVSGDVFCDYDFSRLKGPDPDGLAHLVMVPNPSHNRDGDFALDRGALALSGDARVTYSGIGLFRPEMFAGLSPGFRALRPVLEESIGAGRVSGELHAGTWLDIGTPERLAETNRLLARRATR